MAIYMDVFMEECVEVCVEIWRYSHMEVFRYAGRYR